MRNAVLSFEKTWKNNKFTLLGKTTALEKAALCIMEAIYHFRKSLTPRRKAMELRKGGGGGQWCFRKLLCVVLQWWIHVGTATHLPMHTEGGQCTKGGS